MSKIILLCLFALLTVVHFSESAKIDRLFLEYGSLPSKAQFYTEDFLNGQQLTFADLKKGDCKNFPKRWIKKAKSVDTQGTCVMGCSDLDCAGECKFIFPNNGEQKLSDIKFDRAISSVKSCF